MIKDTLNKSFPELVSTNLLSCMPDYSEFEGSDEDKLIERSQEQYKTAATGFVEPAS
jgi:hypothetical protein